MPIRQLQVSRSVYLALGTNLGERLVNIQRAIDALGPFVAIDAISPVYETEPWGVEDQPDFYNLCLAGRTVLEPAELLKVVKDTEASLGRKKASRWGPRVIDIDIIFYSNWIVDRDRLQLPHPFYHKRAFVLAPLADIAADLRDPVSGLKVRENLARQEVSGIEKLDGEIGKVRKPSRLAWGAKTYVMGILNITADSFSGDGVLIENNFIERTIDKAVEFEEAGVDIIDIGGESTRPGSQPITEQEELERTVPTVRAVRNAVSVPISVDTYRSKVASAALDAGADWINDVWGLKMDDHMVDVAAAYQCPIVIMHNRSKPKNVEQERVLGGRYVGIEYNSLLEDIRNELDESVNLGLQQGINPEQIIVDPGVGFGKSVQQNLKLIEGLYTFREMGYPILIGPSRKSFIGYSLNLPPSERMEGTAAVVTIAIDRGADVIRVHDVKEMVRVARMTDFLVRSGFNNDQER